MLLSYIVSCAFISIAAACCCMSHAGLHKPAARPAVVYLCGAISGMPAAGPVRRDLRQGGALPVGARYFVVAEGKKGLGRRLHLAAGWHNCTIRGPLLLALSRIMIYFPGCCQAFAAPFFGGSFCHSTSAAPACTQTRTSRRAHARRCCYSYYQNVLINPFTLPLILPLPTLLQSLVARSLRLAMARRIRQEFALQLDAVQSARCKYHHGARLVLCVRYFKLINLC